MSNRRWGEKRTRRRFLAGASFAGVAGLAGCIGEDGDVQSPTTGTSTDPGGTTRDEDLLPVPVLGDPEADVTVLAFKDFLCGHCASYELNQFPKLFDEYIEPGTIRYESRDFPIPLGQESWRAPNAARAVQDTVSDVAYWKFAKNLFANQRSLGPSLYGEVAEEVGADPETIKTAAVERSYDPTVKADRNTGIEMGVEGTPAIFVNGSSIKGYGFETIKQAIEAER